MKQISATHDCRTFSFDMCSNHEKTTHFGIFFMCACVDEILPTSWTILIDTQQTQRLKYGNETD